MTSRRIMVMLGARMVRSPGSPNLRFPLLAGDPTVAGTSVLSGGASRMRAIQIEHERLRRHRANDALTVLVTGGRERDGASRAEEAARQLVAKYGLPNEAVVPVESGGSTPGNAEATANYIHANRSRIGKLDRIEIVTNNYHMLRAWLMFCWAMLRLGLGKDLTVSVPDRARLATILAAALPAEAPWSEASIERCRRDAMTILEPYICDLGIRFRPLVVEEVLEASGRAEARRYAALLRNNRWVREALRLEHRGVIDLLEGRYRRL